MSGQRVRKSDISFLPREEAESRYKAKQLAPEAVVIAKVEGGWLVFTSYAAYRRWSGREV